MTDTTATVTRDERRTALEELTKAEIATFIKTDVDVPATTKDALIAMVLEAEYGAADASGGTDGTAGAPKDKDTAEGASNDTTEEPLVAKTRELDEKLGALYEELLTRITEAHVDEATGDTCDQMRAGAAQFLRQCNATIAEARSLLEDCKKVNALNAQQLDKIRKAGEDLERRSQEYNKMAKSQTA